MPNDAPDWTGTIKPQSLQTALAGTAVLQNALPQTLGPYTLPTGTHALRVSWAALGVPTVLQVVGQNTGIDWSRGKALPTFGGVKNTAVVAIDPTEDPTVDIIITFPSNPGNATVWVSSVLDSQVVTLDPSQVGTVQLVGTVGGLAVETLLGRNANPDLGVTMSGATPAPWQAANQPPIQFSAQLGAGTNVQLIAGPAGSNKIYLHAISYYYTATSMSFGAFRRASGSGTQIDAWNSNTAGIFPKDYKGSPFAVGEGLFLSNDSGVNMAGFFNGHIAYSVGT